ncbi:MAG: peptidoglycan editing factor PgeF [Candidatus Omnitrophica bacterium]|nr:peptidoglycan editing factor PgeF [Candidatus Omnitrophota bacterium]
MKVQDKEVSLTERFSTHLLFHHFDTEKVLAGISLKSSGHSRHAQLFDTVGVLPEYSVALNQCHGSNAVLIEKHMFQEGKLAPGVDIFQTDAACTAEPGIMLTVRTADCVPVFLYDPVRGAIALIHAGWRGARLGIVPKTVEKMVLHSAGDPGNFKVLLGPSIRACCYEFGPDEVPEFRPFIRTVGGQNHLDLAAYLHTEIEETGIPAESIFDSGLCTDCHADDFYSYRREKENAGRMISFIMLR